MVLEVQYLAVLTWIRSRINAALKWLAFESWRTDAEKGDVTAQYIQGLLCLSGKGAPQDYAAAAKWLGMAAKQGHADAQFELGTLCFDGKGVPQDHAEAAKWLGMAAKQEHAAAQNQLHSQQKVLGV